VAPALQLTQDAAQIGIGLVVIIGAVLTIIGSFMDWVDLGFAGLDGFDVGYLTDPLDGEGQDGLLVLGLGIAAAGGAVHYFFVRSVWMSLGIMLAGLCTAALGIYNMSRLIYEAKRDLDLSTGGAFDLIGPGIYLAIAGGVIVTIGAFAGAWRATAR
jgi:hypothetical protein